MRCKVIISKSAAKDIQESYEWYENLSDGLGIRFVDFIDKLIGVISMHPGSFPVKKNPYREASLRKFPYLIIYEYIQKTQCIYVLHIFHAHQHPKKKYY